MYSPAVHRGVMHICYALLWLLPVILMGMVTGQAGGVALATGVVLLWGAIKSTGWAYVLPDWEQQVPSWRGAKVLLFVMLLILALIEAGVWGLVGYGLILGCLPLTPALVTASVALSLTSNVLLYETFRASALPWAFAGGGLSILNLLVFLYLQHSLALRETGREVAGAPAVALRALGSLPVLAGVAYGLTALLGIGPDTAVLDLAPTPSGPAAEPSFGFRDVLLWCAGLWLLSLVWRRLVKALDTHGRVVPGTEADQVFGTEEALHRRGGGRGRRNDGPRSRGIEAFLDFFDFLAWQGFPRADGMTAASYLGEVSAVLSEDGAPFADAAAVFNRFRYGHEPVGKEDVRDAEALLAGLRDCVEAFTQEGETGADDAEEGAARFRP